MRNLIQIDSEAGIAADFWSRPEQFEMNIVSAMITGGKLLTSQECYFVTSAMFSMKGGLAGCFVDGHYMFVELSHAAEHGSGVRYRPGLVCLEFFGYFGFLVPVRAYGAKIDSFLAV